MTSVLLKAGSANITSGSNEYLTPDLLCFCEFLLYIVNGAKLTVEPLFTYLAILRLGVGYFRSQSPVFSPWQLITLKIFSMNGRDLFRMGQYTDEKIYKTKCIIFELL